MEISKIKQILLSYFKEPKLYYTSVEDYIKQTIKDCYVEFYKNEGFSLDLYDGDFPCPECHGTGKIYDSFYDCHDPCYTCYDYPETGFVNKQFFIDDFASKKEKYESDLQIYNERKQLLNSIVQKLSDQELEFLWNNFLSRK